jgi:hypothetical protein
MDKNIPSINGCRRIPVSNFFLDVFQFKQNQKRTKPGYGRLDFFLRLFFLSGFCS